MTLRRAAREEHGSGTPSTSRGGCLGWGFFALVLTGSMLLLAVVLAHECSAGSDTISAYAAAIRAGGEVSEAVGGAEAAELTEVLRRTSSVSVANFQGQSGTACFWVRVGGRDARFLLADREGVMEVAGASLRRECECPVDEDEPCHLW